jgi:SagB-type dehydrogenase family enzyme
MRNYPSGGARYPLEVYLIVLMDTGELKEGTYHYNVKFHYLEIMQQEKMQNQVRNAVNAVNEELVSKSPFLLVVSAVFSRSEIKYSHRTYRYLLLEAGHMVQNMYLVSEALGLNYCAIGGFVDRTINELLSFDVSKERALYMFAFGNKPIRQTLKK